MQNYKGFYSISPWLSMFGSGGLGGASSYGDPGLVGSLLERSGVEGRSSSASVMGLSGE